MADEFLEDLVPPETVVEEPMVSFIRLVTGEDMIAEHVNLTEGTQDYYLLVNPMKLIYYANEANPSRINVTMMEWVFPRLVAEPQFVVSARDILTMAQPSVDILKAYMKAVGDDAKGLTEKAPRELSASLDPDLEVSPEEMEYLQGLLQARIGDKKGPLN
jgi:hypothetical protein